LTTAEAGFDAFAENPQKATPIKVNLRYISSDTIFSQRDVELKILARSAEFAKVSFKLTLAPWFPSLFSITNP